MSSEQLELGPVDIVVIGFPPDAPRTGESIPLVVDLVDRGIIRILDVMLVQKDADGVVTAARDQRARRGGLGAPGGLPGRQHGHARETRTPPWRAAGSSPAKPPC